MGPPPCGGKGSGHPVECHEIWSFDDKNKVQTLRGLISLCPSCHLVKHFGLAESKGRGEEARAHLKKVNGWSREKAEKEIQEAFNLSGERSKHNWSLDLSFLISYGLDPKKLLAKHSQAKDREELDALDEIEEEDVLAEISVKTDNSEAVIYWALSKTTCWNCNELNDVVAIGAKERDRTYLLFYVEHAPVSIDDELPSLPSGFRIGNSSTLGKHYFMNHCKACDSPFGDFYLHQKPDGIFSPANPEKLRKIQWIESCTKCSSTTEADRHGASFVSFEGFQSDVHSISLTGNS
jgi:hypothetical protein